ncbi:UNVERIFIED_CONTAM: hypothetical protein GTU68_062331 [Idotea baltica]|nr:hypothetical protein [Idotea baltica]
MNSKDKILAIPTNIITGFLGVGKTTAIRHLLEKKPANERWAVLVNEFGEVGVDGSLFGKASADAGKVPGGCMCCAAGLPMQMALNMLLKRARPDRLLIEPTGLGHPKEVMAVLSAKHYQDVLSINSTITLIDARKLKDRRYTENETFNQQLDIADVIVANKADLYCTEDLLQLIKYLGGRFTEKYKPVFPVRQGALDTSWLTGPASAALVVNEPEEEHSHPPVQNPREELSFPESGYLSIANEGEGFFSQGWVFKQDMVFDREKLNNVMLGISAERAKGVFITKQGIVGFNMVDDVLTEIALDDSMDSRVEIISDDPARFSGLEQQLLSCTQ